mgnify:CR=1 FL=1
MYLIIKFFLVALILSSCATPEEKRLRALETQKKLAGMSDYDLCKKVRIQDWPPSWRGGKGVFWYVTEGTYRDELIKRGVTPFLCSNASKACVGFGYKYGTEKHRSCTIDEGRNIAKIRSQEKAIKAQQEADYLNSISRERQQQDLVTPYLIKRKN